MNYVRPFEPAALGVGETGPWIISPDEGAGCSLRLRRGGAHEPEAAAEYERYALVLAGEVELHASGERQRAAIGDLVFTPSGVSASLSAAADAVWMEIVATAPTPARSSSGAARVITVDQTRFGGGFAYQSLIDRTNGAETLRMNVLQVQPGSGSPDFHIHAFSQIYVIQEGEMTVDIGRMRLKAGGNCVVHLPPGVVHRNFNASDGVERHVSLLVPEPREGEIFDYAVTIHEQEAELMTKTPG